MHKCNDYCGRLVKSKKSGKFAKVCRFGFPRPVHEEIEFRDALEVLGKRSRGRFEKRFYDLPRTACEQCINDYNPYVLLGWKGNMDVSFVGESTTCLANYVCGYVTKSEKGATDLWESIDKNESVHKQLFAYGFSKLRNRQCGIIEAIDLLRGQPLYGMSRSTVYINARMPSHRTVCMKSWTKLQEMKAVDPESMDKYERNWIDDYYPNRPEALESICLYDFMRMYQKVNEPEPQLRFLDGSGGVKLRGEPLLVSHPVFKKPEQIEEYRYSLLLLFKAFRKEVEELLDEKGGCSNIFERELAANSRMAQYHEKLQEQVATFAQNEDAIRKAQEAPDSESQDPDALGMPAHIENAMAELAEAMAVDVTGTTWQEDFEKMNSDQQRVFTTVTSRLIDPNSKPLRMFVSGAGGVGKSFLIHAIKKYLFAHFFEVDGVPAAIAAPTGLAAFNVSGVTLHRLLKLPVQHGKTSPLMKLNQDERKQLASSLRDLKLLIIDELSMVSNLMLLYLDKRFQEIFGGSSSFGGKSILVFGDFMQLKPVNADYIFETIPGDVITAKNLGVGSSNVWERDFVEYDELSINMRQKDDPEYAAILDRLRFGALTEEDVKVLETRLIKFGARKKKCMIDCLADYYLKVRSEDPGVVCLLPKTKMVSEFNSYMLQKEMSEVVQVLAVDRIHGHHTKGELVRARAQLQKRAQNVSTTAGIELVLELAVGARIMLRRNIDVSRGLVNGAIGTVHDFVRNAIGTVTAIKVLFDGQAHLQTIERIKTSFNLNSRVVVFLEQLPVILAYSITIHKSQGVSLSNVVLDAGKNIFQTGMTYVGMSRVRTLAGLHLINFDPSKARCSKLCVQEINRLRSRFTRVTPHDLPFSKLPPKEDRKWYSTESAGPVDPLAAEMPAKATAGIKNARKMKLPVKPKAREPVKKHGRAEQQTNDPLASGSDVVRVGQRSNWPGFRNGDGVSCYANSVVHLLFSCKAFCANLLGAAFGGNLPTLQRLFDQYELHKAKVHKRVLSSWKLRESLGENFLAGEQCAREFLEVILDRASLEDLFRVSYRERCSNRKCPERNKAETVYSSCFIDLDPSRQRTFQDHVTAWVLGQFFRCSKCHQLSVNRAYDFSQVPDQLLIDIRRHTEMGFYDGAIPGCDPDEIQICHKVFHVVAIVQHFGRTNANGHYMALLRTDQGWIRCNDEEVSLSEFPYGLDNVSLMLLEVKPITNPVARSISIL